MPPSAVLLVDTVILLLILTAQWRIWRALSVRLGPGRFRTALAVAQAIGVTGILINFGIVARELPPLHPWLDRVLRIGGCSWSYASTASWLIWTACAPLRRAAPEADPGRRRLLESAVAGAAALPFAAVGYGALIERTDLQVREVDLPVPGLPAGLNGLRIVQISDIHLSPYLSERELARVVDAANELRAQLAAITGDLISTRFDPLDACLKQLSRLKVESEILGCMGNHEIYADAEEYVAQEAAHYGMRFLRRQARTLYFNGAALNVVGVDHQRFQWRDRYLAGAERLVRPGAANLLLSHNPDVFPTASKKGFQAMLAGHTHGGQINFEILDQAVNLARVYTPFVYGLYRDERASAWVTRGVGTVGLPARVNAPPEIVLLRLKRA